MGKLFVMLIVCIFAGAGIHATLFPPREIHRVETIIKERSNDAFALGSSTNPPPTASASIVLSTSKRFDDLDDLADIPPAMLYEIDQEALTTIKQLANQYVREQYNRRLLYRTHPARCYEINS